VDDLEAMGVPVLGELEDFDLDKLKKEMLFTFMSSNPDYEEVVKDYHRHISDYPGMYPHCVQVYSRLKPAAAVRGNRDGNRGDGGDSQSGGRFRPARREHGRFADERPRQDSPVQREKFRFDRDWRSLKFDEDPRQASNEIARRATKLKVGQAQRECWDPTSRQKGFLTTRADAVATVQGECFCFQLYGRCPYGDTVRRAGDQCCKYAHIDKHGKTVTSGVLTTVPSAFVCTRCKAQGKHWSFNCNGGGNGGGPPSRGDRGGRGAGGGGSAGGRGAGGPGRGGAGGGSPGAGGSGRGAAGGGQRGDRGRGRGGDVQRGRLARSVTWQEPIEEPRERFTARKATVDVKETHADSGCSSSISKDVDDFIQLFYKKDPYLIDTAQDGVMMKTHLGWR
jgi:hypothetical protein